MKVGTNKQKHRGKGTALLPVWKSANCWIHIVMNCEIKTEDKIGETGETISYTEPRITY